MAASQTGRLRFRNQPLDAERVEAHHSLDRIATDPGGGAAVQGDFLIAAAGEVSEMVR